MESSLTKSSEILDTLVYHLKNNNKLDDFNGARISKQLLKEIEDVYIVNQSQGLMLKGIFYCLKGKKIEALDNHRLSLNYTKDEVVFTNYISTAMIFNEYDLALDLCAQALKYNEGSINLHDLALDVCYRSGDLKGINQHFLELQKLCINQEIREQSIAYFSIARNFLDQAAPNKVLNEAFNVLSRFSHNFKVNTLNIDFINHDNEYIFFISITSTPEIAAEMNINLAEYWAETPPSTNNMTIIFNSSEDPS